MEDREGRFGSRRGKNGTRNEKEQREEKVMNKIGKGKGMEEITDNQCFFFFSSDYFKL